MEQTIKVDQEALALYSKSPKKCINYLSNYSVETADNTVIRWKELYAFLFTRFVDGNVKTPVPGEQNPKLEQPGYNEEWYRILIEKTGDHYLYHGSDSH
jgi:hypothetical protein